MGGKGSGGKRVEHPEDFLPSSDKQLNLKPGDNSRFIRNGMKIMRLPKVDLNDLEAVQIRIDDYFAIMIQDDIKPTVTGLAMALGLDRRQLWAIVHDQPIGGTYRKVLKPDVLDSLKKAYDFMAYLWEDYMQNGKINPVSGIFLGKNHFGYRDQQEVVVTPNAPLGPEVASDEIEKKYLDSVVASDEIASDDEK